MKILHCSDVRIGMSFPHAYRRAEDLRAVRIAVLRTVLALASREKVAAVILAGNTLADNRLAHEELEELSEVLAGSKVPVFVLPGPLDPLTPDSPYRRKESLFQAPVHVLRDAYPVPVTGGTLLPFPVRSRQQVSAVAEVPERGDEDGTRIAVAYGELDADLDVDYMVLGGGTKDAPEAFDFGEGAGRVTIVNLTAPGAPPAVKHVTTGRLKWQDLDLAVKDVAVVRARLDSLKDRETTLLRLTLRGRVATEARLELDALLGTLADQFYQFDLQDHVAVLPSDEPAYAHPLLRALAVRLEATASQAEGEDGETARAALGRLEQILQSSKMGDLV